MSDSRFPGPWEMNSGCGSRPACGVRHGRPEVTPWCQCAPTHDGLSCQCECFCSGSDEWQPAWCPSAEMYASELAESLKSSFPHLPSPSFQNVQNGGRPWSSVKQRRPAGDQGRGVWGTHCPHKHPVLRGETRFAWSKVPPPQILWRAKIGIKLVDQNSEDAKKIELDWQNNIEMSVFQRDKNLGKWYASVSSL